MATWHQSKNPVKLYGEKTWNVVIDPPNQMRAIMTFSTSELAKVYLRNLKANNPAAAAHSYILKPAKR
jgi:hypothetical protein